MNVSLTFINHIISFVYQPWFSFSLLTGYTQPHLMFKSLLLMFLFLRSYFTLKNTKFCMSVSVCLVFMSCFRYAVLICVLTFGYTKILLLSTAYIIYIFLNLLIIPIRRARAVVQSIIKRHNKHLYKSK